jgi:hypothetical protein
MKLCRIQIWVKRILEFCGVLVLHYVASWKQFSTSPWEVFVHFFCHDGDRTDSTLILFPLNPKPWSLKIQQLWVQKTFLHPVDLETKLVNFFLLIQRAMWMAGLEQVNPEGGIRMSLLTLRKVFFTNCSQIMHAFLLLIILYSCASWAWFYQFTWQCLYVHRPPWLWFFHYLMWAFNAGHKRKRHPSDSSEQNWGGHTEVKGISPMH